jgi:hypothetical protein
LLLLATAVPNVSDEMKKRLLYRILAYPEVGFPLGLGTATWLGAVAAGDPLGYFGFLGLTGMLLGLGAGLTRFVLQGGQLSGPGHGEGQDTTEGSRAESLEQLAVRLRADHDPRTQQHVQQLRQLHERLQRLTADGQNAPTPLLLELRDKAEQLYRCCLTSLERTLQQWNAAQEMSTAETRDQVLKWREDLLDEVSKGIAHLGATLDHLQASSLRPGSDAEGIAEVRDELDIGLQVARNVQARMDDLERGLKKVSQTQ